VTFTDPGMEALRALTCPVRLISGGCSRVPTQRIAAFLAEQIPGATLQVVDDANHLLPVTHHARLGSFLLEQLAE
jgi:pimeloyl-ACP methyl ester carboxylesterase